MARLVMVTIPDLAAGFRLAGTEVVVAGSSDEAAASLERLTADPEIGVLGVHAPFLDGLDPDVRHHYEDLVAPVVVSVPTGTRDAGPESHRARLAALLQRAIGFRISFGDREGEQ